MRRLSAATLSLNSPTQLPRSFSRTVTAGAASLAKVPGPRQNCKRRFQFCVDLFALFDPGGREACVTQQPMGHTQLGIFERISEVSTGRPLPGGLSNAFVDRLANFPFNQ